MPPALKNTAAPPSLPTTDDAPATTSGGELEKGHRDSPRRRRRRLCWGTFAAAAAAFCIVLLALGLTVLRIRDPEMTMNSISVKGFTFGYFAGAGINMTVVADVSVKNPNAASFAFGGSTTSIFYREMLIGVAYGPPGVARARRTLRMNVTVDLLAGEIAGLVGEAGATGGTVGMESSTEVGGRVEVLGVFRHHVGVVMNCTVNVSVADQQISGQYCRQRVWL